MRSLWYSDGFVCATGTARCASANIRCTPACAGDTGAIIAGRGQYEKPACSASPYTSKFHVIECSPITPTAVGPPATVPYPSHRRKGGEKKANTKNSNLYGLTLVVTCGSFGFQLFRGVPRVAPAGFHVDSQRFLKK